MFEKNNHKKRSMRIENAIKNLLQEEGLVVKYKFKGVIDLDINSIKIEVKSAYRYLNRKFKERPNSRIQQGTFRLKNSELNKVDYYFFVVINNKPSNINYIKSIDYFIVSEQDLVYFLFKTNKLTQNYIYLTYIQMLNLPKIDFKDLIKYLKDTEVNKTND